MAAHGFRLDTEGVAGGLAALFHRGGSEAGKADHVACGIDVRHLGLELLVDLEKAARKRF